MKSLGIPRRGVAALVFLAAAVSASTASGASTEPLVCYGNEPSWSLDLEEEGGARLAVLGEEPVEFRGNETRIEPLKERAWRGRTTSGAGGELVAFLREATCSDGMSDLKRPFTARVSLPDGRFLAGCCRVSTFRTVSPSAAGKDVAAASSSPSTAGSPSSLAKAPAGDWAASFSEYLPALRACTYEAMRTEAVVFAERRAKGIVHLVLRLPGKTYADCESPGEGSARISARPRNAPLAPPETAALITLFPGEPPRGKCDRSEPAFDEKGSPFVWITRKGC
jgi:uncharacterized membrane protein